MGISSIAMNGLRAADFSFQKAVSDIAEASSPDGPVDTLDLSSSVIALLSSKASYATDLELVQWTTR